MIRSPILPSQFLDSRRLGRSGGGTRFERAKIAFGPAGRCPHEPTLITFGFDNSGSISSGNDPIGNRYDEAKLAIEAVSRRCRCHHEYCAIVHFDYPTSRCVAPTPLDRPGVETVLRGLEVPVDGAGSSVLGPTLNRAYELAEQYPKHRHLLVVASDFELFDADVAKVLADLRSFPGHVHALVLRAEPPAVLVADESVVVTRIGYDDEPGAVARAVFASLTTHRLQGGRGVVSGAARRSVP
jgi:hypothetical protein